MELKPIHSYASFRKSPNTSAAKVFKINVYLKVFKKRDDSLKKRFYI